MGIFAFLFSILCLGLSLVLFERYKKFRLDLHNLGILELHQDGFSKNLNAYRAWKQMRIHKPQTNLIISLIDAFGIVLMPILLVCGLTVFLAFIFLSILSPPPISGML